MQCTLSSRTELKKPSNTQMRRIGAYSKITPKQFGRPYCFHRCKLPVIFYLYRLSVAQKNQRKTIRRKVGDAAWIRPDGGFAVRPCRLIDCSEAGAKIALLASEKLSNVFYLLLSRNASPGRRAKIKWRKGGPCHVRFAPNSGPSPSDWTRVLSPRSD